MPYPSLPPIWVINLRRSAQRRKQIVAQLDGLAVGYELIEAIDGRDLSPDELAASYLPREAIKSVGRELTRGEIGCSLSHLRLYQRQVAEGFEEVVILEDDVVIGPAFLEVIGCRNALPDDWELVFLHRGDTQVSYWGSRPFGPRHRCVKFASLVYGTQGYLLRVGGARKLLAKGFPVRVPADYLTGGWFRTGAQLYGIAPPCVRERSPGPAQSTMSETHSLHPRWPTRVGLGLIPWILHRSKWGLIHLFRRFNPFSIV